MWKARSNCSLYRKSRWEDSARSNAPSSKGKLAHLVHHVVESTLDASLYGGRRHGIKRIDRDDRVPLRRHLRIEAGRSVPASKNPSAQVPFPQVEHPAVLVHRPPPGHDAVDCEGHPPYLRNDLLQSILTVRFTYRANRIRIFGAGHWRKYRKLYLEQGSA